jgi:hypothetical protein
MEMVRDIPWRPSPLRARSARVAFAVSLLVHAALIARIPIDLRDITRALEPKTEPPLEVRLVPRLVVPPPPAPAAPAPRARPRIVPPPVAPAPKPAPPRPAAAPPPVPSPLALPRAPAGDFSSHVAARQRERAPLEEPAAKPQPAEDADARAKRIIASNLASTRNLTFGFDPSRSGGVFQVTRMSLDYGEFLFFGWNMDAGRQTQQLIEVRRGDASDIRLAMVRKMIEIIRRHEPVEFVWESDRLGRAITLSSRLRDNAGLEDFMMQEFFDLKR